MNWQLGAFVVFVLLLVLCALYHITCAYKHCQYVNNGGHHHHGHHHHDMDNIENEHQHSEQHQPCTCSLAIRNNLQRLYHKIKCPHFWSLNRGRSIRDLFCRQDTQHLYKGEDPNNY